MTANAQARELIEDIDAWLHSKEACMGVYSESLLYRARDALLARQTIESDNKLPDDTLEADVGYLCMKLHLQKMPVEDAELRNRAADMLRFLYDRVENLVESSTELRRALLAHEQQRSQAAAMPLSLGAEASHEATDGSAATPSRDDLIARLREREEGDRIDITMDQAADRIERDAQDAERWRLVRTSNRGREQPYVCLIAFDGYPIALADKEADAAIDAAMGKDG